MLCQPKLLYEQFLAVNDDKFTTLSAPLVSSCNSPPARRTTTDIRLRAENITWS